MNGMKNSFCSLKEKMILYRYISDIQFSSLSLIYNASVDGFKGRDFHKKCDKKERLIVLIKANNFIFGKFLFF